MGKLLMNWDDNNTFCLSLQEHYSPKSFGYGNTILAMDGDNEAQLRPCICGTGDIIKPIEKKEENQFVRTQFECVEKGIQIDVDVEKYEGISVLSQVSTVRNQSMDTHVLTELTSANVNGICYDHGESICHRLLDQSIVVYYCVSKWQGEAQWRQATPEDLGVYMATCHPWEKSCFRLESISSWSCDGFYPIMIIEDKKKKQCWFFEIEAGHSWMMELYAVGGNDTKFLSVKMGGADERLGFKKDLYPGTRYTTCRSVYGVVNGGFEEAVAELIKYKRKTTIVPGGCPLTFNEYMNCAWGKPTSEKLIPLIDKAAEIGAEIFCVDGGWQDKYGYWNPANEKFEGGLQSLFDYIYSKGMKPGIWFEFETIASTLGKELGSDEIYLYRNHGMVARERPLANMRSKVFMEHLEKRVDALYQMGARFIKNDHNNHSGVGSDESGECPAVVLEKNAKAFQDFIDNITKKYPDLIIENCASGGMRADTGTLRHFNIQSTTDQEDYIACTSITAGCLALMPPEKAGIWCYPYPLLFDEYISNNIQPSNLEQYEDGEQTVYNVVNGILGALYISGRIDVADDYNLNLLKEGVEVYKNIYPFIKTSYPIFPMGMIRLSHKGGYAFGLVNEKCDELFLAVFNTSEDAKEVVVDMSKYGMTTCEILYPANKQGVSYRYEEGQLNCDFEIGRAARLFHMKSTQGEN